MRIPKNFNPEPFAYHEEVTAEIESLTNLGDGLGRVNGRVVMVPFSLPGETIRARIFRNHKNYSEADLTGVLDPSPRRVEPRCPLFGACGGCQYQHYEYTMQLEWKTRQTEDALARLAGGRVKALPARPSPAVYGYRSKITPHFQKPRAGKTPAIGFLRRNSRQVIDVPQCLIATDAINRSLAAERRNILSGVHRLKKGRTLLFRETLEGVVTDMKTVVSERVGGIIFQFYAGEFFQNNPFLLPRMVEHVVREAQDEGIRYLADIYCGAGVFCLSAARAFDRLAGVEISAASVRLANANALLNKISNCRFITGRAETIFGALDFPARETAVVLDPPRKGCGAGFLAQLFAYGPRRVVYVSCDPATQARDLKHFLENGYGIARVQPFDLFPQTRHIENVATLVKE